MFLCGKYNIITVYVTFINGLMMNKLRFTPKRLDSHDDDKDDHDGDDDNSNNNKMFTNYIKFPTTFPFILKIC
jgi:hypothetical protein